MSIYKWLWTHIGGRPWTYIIRDFWHEHEFLCIFVLVNSGILLGHFVGFKPVMIGWGIFSLGYICGHLFWGTDYIPHQTDNRC